MATFQFEDILPWGTTGGDTGLSSRMKLKRNFDKIKLYLEALPDFDGILANIMTLQSYFNGGAALQAVKLKTARSLWGQPFDGSDDVIGTLQSVADIEMTGALKMAFGNSWFESKLDTNGDLQLSGNVYALGAVSALGVSAAGIDTGGGGGGGATSLSELSDTVIALPMSAGQALVFDAGKWRNRLLAWNDLSGKPATFPPSEHSADHDVRYYIENGTIYLGNNSITPITSHQSLAAYTPTASYQALNIKVGSTVVGTYAPTQALNFSIAAGSNISVTADATNKKITIANTYSYTHPTNGANTTITAANGKVLSAITVNNLGHVTSVSSKTLAVADIPSLSSLYLPLTGGTLNSSSHQVLTVNSSAETSSVKWTGIQFQHDGTRWGGIRMDEQNGSFFRYNSAYTTYRIWDSGNDGAGSGLDADLLDGHDSGYFATTSALTTLAGTVSTQGGRISTLEGYFTNGSANSALKLAGTAGTGPYTAWGQEYWAGGLPKSISGNMTGVGTISATGDNTITKSAKNASRFAAVNGVGTVELMAAQNNRGVYDRSGNAWLIGTGPAVAYDAETPANPNTFLLRGNVGIGTTTPSQKLHVVGNIMATGAVSCLGTSAEGSEVTGAVYLRDLQDVLITGTPETNYVLTFNGSNWVPQASQGGDMSNWKIKDAQVVEDNSLVLNGEDVIYGAELASNGMLTLKSTRLSIEVPENTSDLVNDSGFISQTTADGRYLKLSGGTMANTNRVVNLNADLLDGKHASDFVPKAGYFYQMDGTAVTPSRILLPLAAGSTGTYSLDLSGYLPLTAGADKPLTGQLYLDTGDTTEVYVNVKSNRATANGGGWAFPLITARNAAGTSVFSMGVYGAAAALNYAYIGAGAWNAANNLRVYSDGSISLGNSIKFQGTNAQKEMITFIDNVSGTDGNGIAIGGGGMTVIGGGESASTIVSGWLADTSHYGGNEIMYIGNDQTVSIFTNLNSGWANRKEFLFANSGSMTMENASYIYFKNSGGTAQNAIGLNSSNALLIGYGTARSGYETYLDGKYISIRTLKDGDTSVTERIRITAAGNVGIGTSQPGQKLHVNGNIAGDSLWLPVAGSVYINDKNMLTYNSSQMLSLGYGMRNDTGTKTDIYGKQVEIKEQKLKIGDCIIEWDSTHGMLKFSNGIYSMGAVSALGVAGDINGQVTKPMTFAADVTIGQYTQNGLNKSYKLCFGDNSHYLFKSGNNIQVFGGTIFQSTMDINSDLTVAGDISAEGEIFCESKISVEEEVEFMIESQTVGTLWVDQAGNLYWKKNGASQSTKIA